MAVFAAPVAIGFLLFEGAVVVSGGVIGAVIAHSISDSIKSDVWKERTET